MSPVERDGFVGLNGFVELAVSSAVVSLACEVVAATCWLAGLAPTVTAMAWLVEDVTIDPSSNMYRFKTKFHGPLVWGAVGVIRGEGYVVDFLPDVQIAR